MEPLTISASEAAKLLGISRPMIYQLMRRADFPVFSCGTRKHISTEGLRAWVRTQAEKGEQTV